MKHVQTFEIFINEAYRYKGGEYPDYAKEDLNNQIQEEIAKQGFTADLNHLDISQVTDMSYLFYNANNPALSKFNGDISKWNVSRVTNMRGMFMHSNFNGDISKWNVSQVNNMREMFSYSEFNGDISKWNVSQVKDMTSMFLESEFNGDISKWNVSQVKKPNGMRWMFQNSKFQGDVSQWATSLRMKSALYELMAPFENLDPELINNLISIAIKKKIPLSGKTLNKPPFSDLT